MARSRIRWAAQFVALAVILAAATSAAAQTTPSTLTGELLTGVPQVTSNCDLGGTSTISYTISGVSGPPYAGTFMESGVATIGPQPNPNIEAVPVETFTASFVIDSPAGQVTGTKMLTQDIIIATGLGFCTEALKSFGIAATYMARIHTADGTFADDGKAGVAVNDFDPFGPPDNFVESFTSRLAAPTPVSTEAAKVTGGGSLVGSPANTGFVVQRKVTDGPVSGQWQFVNQATGDIVHSLSIADLEVTGNTAMFSGTCRNESAPEGTPCSFRVTVQDNGQGANSPPDTFSVAGTGFTGASGALDGNIEIH